MESAAHGQFNCIIAIELPSKRLVFRPRGEHGRLHQSHEQFLTRRRPNRIHCRILRHFCGFPSIFESGRSIRREILSICSTRRISIDAVAALWVSTEDDQRWRHVAFSPTYMFRVLLQTSLDEFTKDFRIISNQLWRRILGNLQQNSHGM